MGLFSFGLGRSLFCLFVLIKKLKREGEEDWIWTGGIMPIYFFEKEEAVGAN